MKTAEEMCRTEYDDNRPENIFMERQVDMKWAIFMMKRYAREAIKADRENVAKHAKGTINILAVNSRNAKKQEVVIDKNSIINAPEIELK